MDDLIKQMSRVGGGPGASACACNPNYSGGRDYEDQGVEPAQANSLRNLISKIPPQKIELLEWHKVKALTSSSCTTNK
jgi:hypothetical protein